MSRVKTLVITGLIFALSITNITAEENNSSTQNSENEVVEVVETEENVVSDEVVNVEEKKENVSDEIKEEDIKQENFAKKEKSVFFTDKKEDVKISQSLSENPIRVGLLFGKNTEKIINFSSQENPFQVGFYDKQEKLFYPVIETAPSRNYYTIKYDEFASIKLEEFSDVNSAKVLYSKMKKKGYKTYLKFGDSNIEVWILATTDLSYLGQVLKETKLEYKDAKIVSPSDRSIVVKGEYDLIFDTLNENRTLRLREVLIKGKRGPIKIKQKRYLKYLGFLEIERKSSGLQVINELPLDEYLYGVVPYEMTDSWHIEALKAQAVVARSYAYTQKYKYRRYGFNVDDTTNSQVYYGYNSKNEKSIKAIDETKGVFVTYNSVIIPAFFSSTAGDYTMSNSQVWGGKELPYLKSKINEYDYEATRYKWNYKSTIYGKDKYFRDGLISSLKRKGYKSNNGKYLENVDEIRLEYFKSSEGVKTRVKKATIIDSRGNYVSISGGKYLFLFYDTKKLLSSKEKFWSSYFRIISDATVEILNKAGDIVEKHGGLKNLNVISGSGQVTTLESTENTQYSIISEDGIRVVNKEMKEISYKGQGWGHGVGMSQWGAYTMAKKGFKYADILKYYYSGVKIEKK